MNINIDNKYPVFTKEMKKTHTIIAPTMFPIHFKFLAGILKSHGYNLEFFKGNVDEAISEGLKSVHNDICYPAMIVIGQLIHALKSGHYDTDKVALIISQTGGGCRASNYIYLLRKALKNNGFVNVPVISLSVSGLKEHPGFKLSPILMIKVIYAMLYGDFLMCLYNQCRPYEIKSGESDIVLNECIDKMRRNHNKLNYFLMKKNYKAMANKFSAIERNNNDKIKVGIVGEIYMKYSPLGNNGLEEFLISEGAEVVMSGVCDFFLYCLSNPKIDNKMYGIKKVSSKIANIICKYFCHLQKKMILSIKNNSTFNPPTEFKVLRELAKDYIGYGVKMGEGWLMTAEMLELINTGVLNVVCTQPFGCLPNHIVGKGMIRKIMDNHPLANIVVIDYDPSATKVNQENRIKLMLSNAKLEAFL